MKQRTSRAPLALARNHDGEIARPKTTYERGGLIVENDQARQSHRHGHGSVQQSGGPNSRSSASQQAPRKRSRRPRVLRSRSVRITRSTGKRVRSSRPRCGVRVFQSARARPQQQQQGGVRRAGHGRQIRVGRPGRLLTPAAERRRTGTKTVTGGKESQRGRGRLWATGPTSAAASHASRPTSCSSKQCSAKDAQRAPKNKDGHTTRTLPLIARDGPPPSSSSSWDATRFVIGACPEEIRCFRAL